MAEADPQLATSGAATHPHTLRPDTACIDGPEDEEQGAEGDEDPEDTTTCPESDSVYAPSNATEEDDESLSIQADQRSTTSASPPGEESCE